MEAKATARNGRSVAIDNDLSCQGGTTDSRLSARSGHIMSLF